MVKQTIKVFLGINSLPESAQHLILKVVGSTILLDMVWNLSTAFYVLFVIDTVGIEQLGILIAIGFLLQAVLDYPSGVLGDWIGQRWILFIGYSFEALAFSILTFADSFLSLLGVYIIRAFAFSQQSGAIETWLDNNYKLVANDVDPQRKIYKFFMGRRMTIGNIVPGVATVLGGILATVFFRRAVFYIQFIGLVIMAVLFFIIVKDYPEIQRPKRSLKSYFNLLGEGVQFVISNRVILLFIIGLCIGEAMAIIWYEMILFPVYYSYTGSDAGVGILRFIIMVIGTVLTFYASKLVVKVHIKRIPLLRFLDTVIFYWGIALLTYLFPIEFNTFNPLAILLLIVNYSTIWLFYTLGNILAQRLFLDVVPDRNRNSIYSLIPTLLLLFTAPCAVIGASLIKNLGISITAFLLGMIGLISVVFYYSSVRLIPEEDKLVDV
ncbi:MAG: MFS transporter [Candidatus Hermodarchaeota archaeon]